MGSKRSLSSKIIIDLPPNDDETERMLNRRQSLTPTISSNTLAQFNEYELDNHYNYCIKLANENKITSKNAFSLKMIEFLSMRYIGNKGVIDNFQAAGKELETSAKIYACRVDALHSDTMNLASSIRMGTKKGNDEIDIENENDNEHEDENPKKQIPVKKKIKKFICHELEKINRKPEKNYRVNTNLQKSNKNGCNFLYTCSMLNDYGEILLDTETLFWNFTNINQEFEEDIRNDKNILLENIPSLNKDISNLKMTSKLEGFCFNASPSQLSNNINVNLNETKVDDDLVFNQDADIMPINDDIEAPEGEQFLSDNEERNALRQSAFKSAQPIFINEMSIDQLRPHLKGSEYSYFTGNLLNRRTSKGNWIPKIVSERMATAKKSVRKKFRIVDIEIDFEIQPSKLELNNKSSLYLNLNTNSTFEYIKDYSIDNFDESLLKYFIHSNLKIKENKKEPLFVENEDSEYNYENPADMTDYCPSVLDQEDDVQNIDEEIFYDGINFSGLQNNDHNSNNENQLIFQIKIPKPIDMKKLKDAILYYLTKGKRDQAPLYDEMKIIMEDTTFTKLWSTLPKLLPSEFISNLSVGLVNFAILQICNEFDLKLLNDNDINDFSITKHIL